ncbi:hypothetical protein EVAR_37335_1 [Eumeta japonica]|uniref:Uncharacterized protein n=1 Tax=Eumeta variegata TaxID=151549 RepID=A0A4C1WZJ2_EUMVA|nr:hypothetical protein EVAR_37335_1 [Eumeta japonica]
MARVQRCASFGRSGKRTMRAISILSFEHEKSIQPCDASVPFTKLLETSRVTRGLRKFSFANEYNHSTNAHRIASPLVRAPRPVAGAAPVKGRAGLGADGEEMVLASTITAAKL